MRRLVMALLALTAVMYAAPASAATTKEELNGALLSAGELGSGFSVVETNQMESLGVQGTMAGYMRMPSLGNPSIEIVMAILLDVSAADTISTADLARQFEQLERSGVTLTPTTAPAIGDEAVMYTVTAEQSGLTMTGDLVAWRHGNLMAAVLALGTEQATATGYAARQEAKLAAAFGVGN